MKKGLFGNKTKSTYDLVKKPPTADSVTAEVTTTVSEGVDQAIQQIPTSLDDFMSHEDSLFTHVDLPFSLIMSNFHAPVWHHPAVVDWFLDAVRVYDDKKKNFDLIITAVGCAVFCDCFVAFVRFPVFSINRQTRTRKTLPMRANRLRRRSTFSCT